MTLFHCCSPFSCSWDFQNSFFPRGCHKAYHPACVEKDRDFLNSDEEFICGKHFIVLCLIFLWAPIIVVKMHVTVPGTILAYWKLAYLIICHYLPFFIKSHRLKHCLVFLIFSSTSYSGYPIWGTAICSSILGNQIFGKEKSLNF